METDLELKSGSKRKKNAEELSAFNDLNPELSQSDYFCLSQAAKRCGTKFTTVLTQEKEKKKISIVFKVLTNCKTEYEEIIGRLIMENMVLSGRLAEARVNHEVAQVYNRTINARLAELLPSDNRKGPEQIDTATANVSLTDELQTAKIITTTPKDRRKQKNISEHILCHRAIFV